MRHVKEMLTAAIVLGVILLPMQSFGLESGVPPLVNYQGKLITQGQTLSDGEYTLSFSIYDKAMEAPCKTATDVDCARRIWGPQVFDGMTGSTGHGARVRVANGNFNVLLCPLDVEGRPITQAFISSRRFLEVTIEDRGPILPRQQAYSQPYALRSGGDVPVGAITMFFGKEMEVSANWAVCNGSEVTDPSSPLFRTSLPDLRGMFVKGASNDVELLADGGQDQRSTHKHSVSVDVKVHPGHVLRTTDLLCTDIGDDGICNPRTGIDFSPWTSHAIIPHPKYSAVVVPRGATGSSHGHPVEVKPNIGTDEPTGPPLREHLDNRPRHVNLYFICRIK